MITLAATNIKGGVGKTTNILHLALAAIHSPKKPSVLLIDLDPQCNLTLATIPELLKPKDENQDENQSPHIDPDSYIDKVVENLTGQPVETSFKNLWIYPASPKLVSLQNSEIIRKPGAYLRLRKILRSTIQEYFDYVLIDTAASFTLIHAMALSASDFYIISLMPECHSTIGMGTQIDEIEKFKKDTELSNPTLAARIINNVPKQTRIGVDWTRQNLTTNYENLLTFEIPSSSEIGMSYWTNSAKKFHTLTNKRAVSVNLAYKHAWKSLTKFMEKYNG